MKLLFMADGNYAVYVYDNTKSNLLDPSENAT